MHHQYSSSCHIHAGAAASTVLLPLLLLLLLLLLEGARQLGPVTSTTQATAVHRRSPPPHCALLAARMGPSRWPIGDSTRRRAAGSRCLVSSMRAYRCAAVAAAAEAVGILPQEHEHGYHHGNPREL